MSCAQQTHIHARAPHLSMATSDLPPRQRPHTHTVGKGKRAELVRATLPSFLVFLRFRSLSLSPSLFLSFSLPVCPSCASSWRGERVAAAAAATAATVCSLQRRASRQAGRQPAGRPACRTCSACLKPVGRPAAFAIFPLLPC